MRFQQWISFSKELLDTISHIPSGFVESTKMYNSKHFCFLYDEKNNSCTFKGLYVPPVEPPAQIQTQYQVGSATTPGTTVQGNWFITSPVPGSHPIYPSAPTSPLISTQQMLAQVSCTIKDGILLDLRYITKSSYNAAINMLNTGGIDYEDGGTLVYSTLYFSDSVLMVNGVLYDIENSPKAFNEDLMNNDGVSILELAEIRQYHANK